MFRGISTLSLDAKGRLAIPSRYRELLASLCNNRLVLTLSPRDPCLWLYPLPAWEAIDAKLEQLSDFDEQSRRTKQVMRGYAEDCELDSQGRIRIPDALRSFVGLEKRITLMGQGNKFALWDEGAWNQRFGRWLQQVSEDAGAPSEILVSLSL